MSVTVNRCKKKDECHNYPRECDLCIISSDSVNPHPYFEDRDLVEVVRCKDCTRGFRKFLGKTAVVECQLYHHDDKRQYKDPSDYCSHGVRREKDGDL